MKFAILLLFCCCAVALARPDGSKEVAKPPKPSSGEVKHSGSGESKESSDESSDKSSNESGKKDDGGAVTGTPSVQQVELLLDRGVEIVASLFGLHNIHGVADLIHLIESNPIGNIIWTIVIHPFLRNILQYQKIIISFLSSLQSTVLHYIPISQLFIPLQLPEAIIQFVLRILQSIAQIFNSF